MQTLENIPDSIPNSVYDDAKFSFELYYFRDFTESLEEDSLGDISEQDLLDAIKAAQGGHDEYLQYVNKKTEQLGDLIQYVSIPIAIEDLPVGLAGSVILKKIVDAYRNLFSVEVEMRKRFIDKLGFKETSGNVWVDNRRWAFNLQMHRTKFLSRMLSVCMVRSMAPNLFHPSFEFQLCLKYGQSRMDCVSEMKSKFLGGEPLARMIKAEDEFPIDVQKFSEEEE